MRFRWNDWNTNHIAEHGLYPADAEYVVNYRRPPFPRYQGDGRYMVRGQTGDGLWIQVVYIFSPPGIVYVIHARPLNDREKRSIRRRRR